MKRIAVAAAVVAAFAIGLAVGAESTGDAAARRADIMKLMSLAGVDKLGANSVDRMMKAMEEGRPDVPQSLRQEIRASMRPDDLTVQLVAVYDKHLTADDLKAFIAFYESPVGRRMLEVMPLVQAETFATAQRWSLENTQRARDKLVAAGYIKPQPRPATPGGAVAPAAPQAPTPSVESTG
jgi:hypothetical protein